MRGWKSPSSWKAEASATARSIADGELTGHTVGTGVENTVGAGGGTSKVCSEACGWTTVGAPPRTKPLGIMSARGWAARRVQARAASSACPWAGRSAAVRRRARHPGRLKRRIERRQHVVGLGHEHRDGEIGGQGSPGHGQMRGLPRKAGRDCAEGTAEASLSARSRLRRGQRRGLRGEGVAWHQGWGEEGLTAGLIRGGTRRGRRVRLRRGRRRRHLESLRPGLVG